MTARRLLLTGRTGFVGQVLRGLVEREPAYNLQERAPSGRMELRERESLLRGIEEIRPHYVIHLAAQSFVPRALENPRETLEINLMGTLNLLEALRQAKFSGRLLYVGSGDEYGLIEAAKLPVREDHPLRPRNPYAVSKAAAEMLCYQWAQTEKLDIVMARPFNHIGPGQDERFAISAFAKQLAEIRLGRRPAKIEVGNLEVSRDFSDVEDVARAYLLLLGKGKSGDVYNVCSGNEHGLKELLTRLIELADIDVDVVLDPARQRPAEQSRMVGDHRRLTEHTGWEPEVSIDRSLEGILAYWEHKLKNE
jgi:GDP-D-mannose dehydratase